MISRIKTELKRLRNIVHNRIYISPKLKKDIVDQFHKIYYEPVHWEDGPIFNTFWLGVQTLKCPLDLWIYQEIIFELIRNNKPLVIIETGTHLGGSALFLACICDSIGNGRIISIDIIDKFSNLSIANSR